MEENPGVRSHRHHPENPVLNKESAHDIKNAEITMAKEQHLRPQDRDKPDFDDDLQIGDSVYFFDHEKHQVQGIISDILPRANELLGENMTTKEGRSVHGGERLYQISSSTGTATTRHRSELSKEPEGITGIGSHTATTTTSSDRSTPPYILQNEQRHLGGKEGALLSDRNPPHRH